MDSDMANTYLLRVALLAYIALGLAAAACPVTYGRVDPSNPLLFGSNHGACTSGCESRESIWSQVCKLDPSSYSTWGVCEQWQRPAALQVASQLSGGGIAAFSPCDLQQALGNRTLWIIGDSHVKGLYYTLRCFMMDLWDHAQGECAASSNATLQTQLERTSLQGHPYNTPPRCLHIKGSGGRFCLVHSPIGNYLVTDKAKEPGTLQLLHQSFTAPQDVVYISVGRWHANNCQGIHPSYAKTLEAVAKYVQASRSTLPQVLWGAVPHDHTKCDGRELDFAAPACLPAPQGGYNLSLGHDMAGLAHRIMGRHRVSVLDSYNASLQLHDGHVTLPQSIAGVLDCLHFCRPSLGEIDVWKITQALKSSKQQHSARTGEQQQQAARAVPAACVPVEPLLPLPYGRKQRGSLRVDWMHDVWGYPYMPN
ncbi:hypothetical protein COO60DRAFT_466846 [Scenedesmus sp. NREL 46B-D3]|nr:hypothetical protein COO60DRAFT_466846 [Scenedesmus sp. NREL 46B-D3]